MEIDRGFKPRITTHENGLVSRIGGLRCDINSEVQMDLARTQDGDVIITLRDSTQPDAKEITFESLGYHGGGRHTLLTKKLSQLIDEIAKAYASEDI